MKRPGSLGKCFIFSDGNEVIVVECVHESPPEKHLSCCQKYGGDSNPRMDRDAMLFSYSIMFSIY